MISAPRALTSMAVPTGKNMASYFVASLAPVDGAYAVHDRSRCPPGAFPLSGAEYLGEFLDAGQAVAVARLRYLHAASCACCACAPPAPVSGRPALAPARP
jgi:hypothetical protein